MRAIVAFILATIGCIAGACSVFYAFDGKLALAGDSEDWIDPNTQVWFVPKTAKTHGVMYFGFGLGQYPEGGIKTSTGEKKLPEGGVINIKPSDAYGFPQAGMNDQGLFFGGAATDLVPATTSGKPKFPGFFADHVLRNCATVPEALAIIRKFDLGLPQGQIMLGDKLGNSAVIEAGNVILEKSGKHQVMTNFRLSTITNGSIACDRYKRLDATLSKVKTLSVKLARDAIASVGFKPQPDSLEKRAPGTQYSVVFDLTHGIAHLYKQADFEHPVALNVKAELAKGKRAMKMFELFDSSSLTAERPTR